jgi:hypothetical protein
MHDAAAAQWHGPFYPSRLKARTVDSKLMHKSASQRSDQIPAFQAAGAFATPPAVSALTVSISEVTTLLA